MRALAGGHRALRRGSRKRAPPRGAQATCDPLHRRCVALLVALFPNQPPIPCGFGCEGESGCVCWGVCAPVCMCACHVTGQCSIAAALEALLALIVLVGIAVPVQRMETHTITPAE